MKILDAGNVLEGARKHLWAGFNNITDGSFKDGGDYVSSDYFKAINFEKMLENGYCPKILAAIKAIQCAIPRKPRKSRYSHRIDRWNSQFVAAMNFAQQLLEHESLTEDFIFLKADLIGHVSFLGFANKIKAGVYLGFPYVNDLGDARVEDGYDNVITGKTGWLAFNRDGRIVDGTVFESRDKALESLKLWFSKNQPVAKPSRSRGKVKFNVYIDRVTKLCFIGVKRKHGVVRVVTDVNDSATLRAMISEDYDSLVAKFEEMHPSTSFWSKDQLTRVGPTWTSSTSISPEKLVNEFGLRGIQYGNYVGQKERKAFNVLAYNGLCDMAEVLGIPRANLGVSGSQGLAYGARGKGGVNSFLAHFEPINFNINLIKGLGIGAYAHEYGHLLSHYYGAIAKTGRKSHFEVDQSVIEIINTRNSILPSDLSSAFKSVYVEILKTGVRARSLELDKFRSKTYWTLPEEMFARSFERWVQYEMSLKGMSNGWLVSISKSRENDKVYPYPTQVELQNGLCDAFRNLMKVIASQTGEYSLGDLRKVA